MKEAFATEMTEASGWKETYEDNGCDNKGVPFFSLLKV